MPMKRNVKIIVQGKKQQGKREEPEGKAIKRKRDPGKDEREREKERH